MTLRAINSRLENLTAFKRVYVATVTALKACIARTFPQLSADELERLFLAFFPFLFGIYPFTVASDKQKAAFAQLNFEPQVYTISQLVFNLLQPLLRAL